jgi:hypothetical protein
VLVYIKNKELPGGFRDISRSLIHPQKHQPPENPAPAANTHYPPITCALYSSKLRPVDRPTASILNSCSPQSRGNPQTTSLLDAHHPKSNKAEESLTIKLYYITSKSSQDESRVVCHIPKVNVILSRTTQRNRHPVLITEGK